jgi:hypothetical protein
MTMLGLLVHGSNHFVVRGPRPNHACARRLMKSWELVTGLGAPEDYAWRNRWSISTREFREDLEWCIVLRGGEPVTPAVAQLVMELAARGVEILYGQSPYLPIPNKVEWPGEAGC